MQEGRCFSGALFAKERYFPWALFEKKALFFWGSSVYRMHKRCKRDAKESQEFKREPGRKIARDSKEMQKRCKRDAKEMQKRCKRDAKESQEFKCKGDAANSSALTGSMCYGVASICSLFEILGLLSKSALIV